VARLLIGVVPEPEARAANLAYAQFWELKRVKRILQLLTIPTHRALAAWTDSNDATLLQRLTGWVAGTRRRLANGDCSTPVSLQE